MSVKYAQAIYGNLAYEASEVAAADRKHELPVRPQEQETQWDYEEPIVQTEMWTRTASKQAVSPFAVVGCVCVLALLFMMLLSYISLAEISKESVDLNAQLEILNNEETRLKLNYERAFDLNEVERYATNELGMTKAGESQVCYISNNTADQAVVLQVEGNGEGVISYLGTFLSRLVDVFS